MIVKIEKINGRSRNYGNRVIHGILFKGIHKG